MSLRPGGPAKEKPAHQNAFAFKHNPNSKKTRQIHRISHGGLCKRCQEQIEWRKKYRKYKPLKSPSTCNGCKEKTITRAYHTLCDACANEKNVCAKCNKLHDEEESTTDINPSSTSIKRKIKPPTEEELAGMRERERRTALRNFKRTRRMGGEEGNNDDDEGDDGEDDDDVDMSIPKTSTSITTITTTTHQKQVAMELDDDDEDEEDEEDDEDDDDMIDD
jgi:hypothetical protein